MPNYQGNLDGLCGPYAVVNAFERCGVQKLDEVFETACSAIALRRWPKVLWEGTSFGDLRRMIRRCKDTIGEAASIRTSYPFHRKTPKSNESFWKELDQILTDRPSVRCMILGLTRPDYHWIVAHRETSNRLTFVDTDPHNPSRRKNRKMLYAGVRNGHPSKWIIDRGELILFEVN